MLDTADLPDDIAALKAMLADSWATSSLIEACKLNVVGAFAYLVRYARRHRHRPEAEPDRYADVVELFAADKQLKSAVGPQ